MIGAKHKPTQVELEDVFRGEADSPNTSCNQSDNLSLPKHTHGWQDFYREACDISLPKHTHGATFKFEKCPSHEHLQALYREIQAQKAYIASQKKLITELCEPIWQDVYNDGQECTGCECNEESIEYHPYGDTFAAENLRRCIVNDISLCPGVEKHLQACC